MEAKAFEDFLVSNGLYSELAYEFHDIKDVTNLLSGKVTIDMYCPHCGEKRIHKARSNKVKSPEPMPVFQIIDGPSDDNIDSSMDDFMQRESQKRIKQFSVYNKYTLLTYECTKEPQHSVVFVLLLTPNSLIKFGQYPSFADIDKPELARFKKDLGENYFRELKRASGLYANGVGIGSFVYLRRILEKLVLEAFKEAEARGQLTSEEFNSDSEKHQRRMDDKIRLLKGFLPYSLTDNPAIYSVASKGIHELTEDECLKYYPVIENGIKLILEEKMTERQRAAIKKEYDQSMSAIVQKIKR